MNTKLAEWRKVTNNQELSGISARAFSDGMRAADDEARLCSRKLRVALVALTEIAVPPAGAANGESAEVLWRRSLAQAALDRIGGLK
jgi:hypothetical protein